MSSNSLESVHDFLTRKNSALDVFFKPQRVAVIGATESAGTVGRTVLKNLLSSPFGGAVFPVNPKRPHVLGVKAYPSIGDIAEPIDLAVIMTPAPTVPGIVQECVSAGVKGAIVISAGFKETGAAGADLEKQILAIARGKMRIIGPNCLGVMNPLNGFNATFAATTALPGTVGFISQSGALLTAILDWSLQEKLGFSAFVSIGSMLDVGWGDLIDYLGDDPQTQSIVIYMETIGDARSFLSAAREVALNKPIIVIKAGRSEGAAKAAASHTGSLAGSDDVLDAAFRRCGVLRVNRISDLFHMAEVLGKQPRPKGRKLTILTNAGGPGVLATDTLLQKHGELAPLSKDSLAQLSAILPPAWSHNNPIDVLGDADAHRYAKALEIAAADPNSDGLLVILTPQAMTNATETARALTQLPKVEGKPLLASWMGGDEIREGTDILRQANIPVFTYPDTAAAMFMYMWDYVHSLQGLYETPSPAAITEEGYLENSRALITKAREGGRTLLTEPESKDLLKLYGIPITETRVVESETEAVKAAEKMGYPVVLKLFSLTITHKTDVGGVALDLRDASAVRAAFRKIQANVIKQAGKEAFQGVTVQEMVSSKDAYELIVGSSPDSQFGPVLLFGSGGQLVEVYKDKSLGFPPLNTTLARRMMERTRIYQALKGVRGRSPIDMKALEQLLVRFSQLVVDHPRIREIEINPLLASPDGLVALDARVILYEARIPDAQLPKSAIRPYPVEYVSRVKLKDGTRVLVRPIRHQDEPLMRKFHESLSERSVYLRYLKTLQLDERVTHERLLRRCFIDYDREIALVAELKNDSSAEFLGVARLVRIPGTANAELTVLISDKAQRKGLGIELIRRLLQVAKDRKLERVEATVLRENEGMCRLLQQLNFTFVDSGSGLSLKALFVF